MSDFIEKSIADAYFEDIFDAYRQLGKLYNATTNPTAKQSIKQIKNTMDLGLNRLCVYGWFAKQRYEEARERWPN